MEELVSIVELPDWKSILMDIVHSEGFDPWDIDVAALARTYLKRIQQMRELNLTVPANAVLACSILLSLKAKKLKEFYMEWVPSNEDVAFTVSEPEPEPIFVPEASPELDNASKNVPQNVVVPQRIVPRKITLDELISAVERIMLAKKKVHRPAPPPPVEEFFENMERDPVADLVNSVYKRIKALLSTNESIRLEEILPDRKPSTLVKYLLALLYLANEKKIVLHQDKPFEDVRIALPGDGNSGSKENS